MATIFQPLRKEHDKQRTLALLLTKTHGDRQASQDMEDRLQQ